MLCKQIQNPPDKPYLDWIKSGKKVYEGRLQTKIVEWDLFVGKKIKFYESDDSWVICLVTALLTYADFGDAYDDLGEALIPGGKTRDEVVLLYNDIFGDVDDRYSTIPCKLIRDHGAIAIGIRVVEKSP